MNSMIPGDVRCPAVVGPGGLRCELPLGHDDRHRSSTATWTKTAADFEADRAAIRDLRRRTADAHFDRLRSERSTR